MDKMDAISENFRRNATKYVAEVFFNPHRNKFCQKLTGKRSVNLRPVQLWGRTLNLFGKLSEITISTLGCSK